MDREEAKKNTKLDKEDKELLEMIGKTLEKKRDRKLSDFIEGSQITAKSQIDRLFNKAHYQSIDLSEDDQ